MFNDIIQSLRYLHNHQLIHRDLSCKNLLLFPDKDSHVMHLKLCDFGVSTCIDKDTFASTQIGTPHTMSPEIFDAKGYNDKVDIWAAGCVFYELFCRQQLFAGLNYLALIKALEEFTSVKYGSGPERVYGR